MKISKVLLFVSCKRDEVGKIHTVIYCFCLVLVFIDAGEGEGRAEMEGSDLKYKQPAL